MARNKRIYTRDDVETRNGRPCVNVKVYGTTTAIKLPMCLGGSRPADQPNAKIEWSYTDPAFTHEWIKENVDESAQNSAFEWACSDGWDSIKGDAKTIFGPHVTVYQEGRSGGWAVVHGLPDVDTWDAIALKRWQKFEKYAKLYASDVLWHMVDSFYHNVFKVSPDPYESEPYKLTDGRCILYKGVPQFTLHKIGNDADGYTCSPETMDAYARNIVVLLNADEEDSE